MPHVTLKLFFCLIVIVKCQFLNDGCQLWHKISKLFLNQFSKFLWLSCRKFPGLLKNGQKDLCTCSRSRENGKKKVGPIIWDTLYIDIYWNYSRNCVIPSPMPISHFPFSIFHSHQSTMTTFLCWCGQKRKYSNTKDGPGFSLRFSHHLQPNMNDSHYLLFSIFSHDRHDYLLSFI